MASAIPKRPLCYPRKPFTQGTPKPTGPPAPRVLGALLDRVDATAKVAYDDWRPIADFKNYIEIRKREAKTEEHHKMIDDIIAKHEEYYKNNPKPEEEPKPREPQYSNVIDPNHPLAGLLKKNLTPQETIEIYKNAGYSREFLENLEKAFEEKEKKIAMNNDYIDKVLVNYPGKSTTKKKKVSIRARFAAKMRNKNIIKEEDLEDDGGECCCECGKEIE